MYMGAMSQTELEAYLLALHGTIWDEAIEAEDPDDVERDWQRAGCDGAASHAVEEATGVAYHDTGITPLTPYDELDAMVDWFTANG